MKTITFAAVVGLVALISAQEEKGKAQVPVDVELMLIPDAPVTPEARISELEARVKALEAEIILLKEASLTKSSSNEDLESMVTAAKHAQEDREIYFRLAEPTKKRFAHEMKAAREIMQTMSYEEKREYARLLFEKITLGEITQMAKTP